MSSSTPEVSVLVPAPKYGSTATRELRIPVAPSDLVQDLAEIVYESAEGHWLGSFGFLPLEKVSGRWERLALDEAFTSGTVDGSVLSEQLEIGAVFDLENVEKNSAEYALEVRPTPFTPLGLMEHVIRLQHVGVSKGADVRSLKVDEGTTVLSSLLKDPRPVIKVAEGLLANSAKVDRSDAYDILNVQKDNFASFNERTTALRGVSVSPWSPPSQTNRLRGHIVYLKIETVEREVYHVTGSTNGFWVNGSTDTHFDPQPLVKKKKNVTTQAPVYPTLFELLGEMSPSFAARIALSPGTGAAASEKDQPSQLYERLSPASVLPLAAPWLIAEDVARPQPDLLRSQLAFLQSGGLVPPLWTSASAGTSSNIPGTLPPVLGAATTTNFAVSQGRDWNDDLCTYRELARESLQEQVLRERFLNFGLHEFASAALNSLKQILAGDVRLLNPLMPDGAHTYLHNNMTFTRADDSANAFRHIGGVHAAVVAPSKDLIGVKILQGLDIPGLHTMASLIADYGGHRWVVQTLVPGLLNPDDARPLKILYGSVNPDSPGEEVASDEQFAPFAEQIASELHLAPHTVTSDGGDSVQISLPAESHGIAAPDGRMYLVDAARLQLVDIEFLEGHKDYIHGLVFLRPELVTAYTESLKTENSQEDVSVSFNPDAFVTWPADASSAGRNISTPDDNVRAASKYLQNTVLPQFIVEMVSGTVVIPDGFFLTQLLHHRGINIRYLGQLATLAKTDAHSFTYPEGTHGVPWYLSRLVSSFEKAMLIRGAKHAIRERLAAADHSDYTRVIATALSEIFQGGPIRDEIRAQIKSRFLYDLDITHVDSFSVLRELTQRLGVQLALRHYTDTVSPEDIVNLYPVIRYTNHESLAADRHFDLAHQSMLEGKLETGQSLLADALALYDQIYGQVHPKIGIKLQLAALLYNMIAQTIQRRVALHTASEASLESLKKNLESAQQKDTDDTSMKAQKEKVDEAQAEFDNIKLPSLETANEEASFFIAQSRKMLYQAIVITERTVGIDTPETAQQYADLTIVENAAGNVDAALLYTKRAIDLWTAIYGPDHPNIFTLLSNVAVIIQRTNGSRASAPLFAKLVTLADSLYGPNSIQVASAQLALAHQHAQTSDFSTALECSKAALAIYGDVLGPEHADTKDAERLVKILSDNATFMERLAARAQLQSRTQANGANGAKPHAHANGNHVETKAPELQVPHGQKADLPIDELVKYIQGPAKKKSHKKGKK